MFDTLEGGEGSTYSILADTAEACRERCRHRVVEVVRAGQRQFVERNFGGVGRKGSIEDIDDEVAVLDVSTRDKRTVAHLLQTQTGERDKLCLERFDVSTEGIQPGAIGSQQVRALVVGARIIFAS